jgi:cephalosporin-C deacetylase-like acetyl esterase
MRPLSALVVACAAFASVAADFKDIDPNVFPKDDPRAKELPRMVWKDATRRMQEANLRESKAFAEVTTKEQWEKYRDTRIQKLKESLGTFPEPPKEMRVKVTRELPGDGFVIRNLLYETRPGLWVSANLYLPAKPPERMPGILISHAHHTPKTHGELQDMGMTWARSGVAVLVPDHLGHGERRQHDFKSEKDYGKPFRASRQDYYFRYNSNLQLTAAGESLMGWMVWDLMRGIDVLLKQEHIDPKRIILLGAVAGGGDPAGVTAALDPRVACVVPFNFGGWQPESSVNANPDRDTPWFGEGYWESTRGLRNGARDGFAHFVIVGSVAPRPVIHAHEFAWDGAKDPAWPRLRKIFGFYGAKDKIVPVHGKGKVTGQAGPDNTHCTHVGRVHRAGIYPALKEWFGMPVPEEYSKRLPAEDLMCWTDKAKKELNYRRPAFDVAKDISTQRFLALMERLRGAPEAQKLAERRTAWLLLLGDIEPPKAPKLIVGVGQDIPGATLQRFALEPEPGIVVPFLLLTPKDAKGKAPAVLMVAQGGKSRFLKERREAIEEFLKAGVIVCLVDVRGTGETAPGDGSPERTSSRTSVSQTNLILGQPVIGSQLRDLRTVIRWLQSRENVDPGKLAVWGDSFAKTNPDYGRFAVPLDAPDLPRYAEPGGALLAALAKLAEPGVALAYAGGGTAFSHDLLESPYLYVPHDAVIPGAANLILLPSNGVQFGLEVDYWNVKYLPGKEKPWPEQVQKVLAKLGKK